MIGKVQRLKDIQHRLKSMTDSEKINYLRFDLPEDIDYIINIDNDSVYIHLGYNKHEESIGVEFDEFGYSLLRTLFECLALKSDFV
jgi:hypothetical protein